MSRLKIMVEYFKSFLWVVFRGKITVYGLNTSNGFVIAAEKRGVGFAVEKNHWVSSYAYPRRYEELTLVEKEPFRIQYLTGTYKTFEAGSLWSKQNSVSYGSVKIAVQHEPYYGTHYHVVGRNKDGSFWVISDGAVKGPFERVDVKEGGAIRVHLSDKRILPGYPERRAFQISNVAPIKFIYGMF